MARNLRGVKSRSITVIKDSIDIWKTGFMQWQYRAFGELYRPRIENNFITMPDPNYGTTLGEGITYTKWGAERRAKRVLRYR